MIRNTSPTSYSSDVRISLRIGNRVFDVAQVHDQACLVRNPDDIATCQAELTITVDGTETTESVMLPNGIAASFREVPLG